MDLVFIVFCDCLIYNASMNNIKKLRSQIEAFGLDAFIVPRTDEHQNEYVAPNSERLKWLTGFDGSAGVAIVGKKRAAIFVDGRYTLQVTQQVDSSVIAPMTYSYDQICSWISKNIPKGGKVGFDPWLHTPKELEKLYSDDYELCEVEQNPVDLEWVDKPAAPMERIYLHETEYSGKSSSEKIKEMAAKIRANEAQAAVLSMCDSIAWLLNFRGNDIPCTPTALCFAIVYSNQDVELFIDLNKVTADVNLPAKILSLEEFPVKLSLLKSVIVDDTTMPAKVISILSEAGAEIFVAQDFCTLPKACKNDIEIQGAINAHRRDGAALCTFLAWLNNADQLPNEYEAAKKLDSLRLALPLSRGLSFDTISGSGPNGAIVHYRVQKETARQLQNADIYLVDSGGQYPDGTTDVTRTVIIGGKATQEQRDRFTRVLKGHIAIANTRFPVGTCGEQLDVLARKSLWDLGLDYAHGTGHGVGSFLCVHEGPQRISKSIKPGIALQPGMIVSNEPGYYKEGAYGIRIESLVLVVPDPDHHGWLKFDTLTMVPIALNLIEPKLLTADEKMWLNDYHRRVYTSIAELVDESTKHWLQDSTFWI